MTFVLYIYCAVTCLHVFVSVFLCPLRGPCKNYIVCSVRFYIICFVVVHALFVICIYLHKMVFNAISLSDNVTVTRWVPLLEQEMHTLLEHLYSSWFSSVVFVLLNVFLVMFCRSMLVLLFFLCWPLYYLSFNVQHLITSLVSSNVL